MHYRFSIREMIRQDFGVDLPLGMGSGTAIDDPLTLEASVAEAYVSVENQYLDYLSRGRGVEFKLQAREKLELPGVVIDVVKIHTRPLGEEADWQAEMYYFDISRCVLARANRRLGYEDFPHVLARLGEVDATHRQGCTKAEREAVPPWLASFDQETALQRRNHDVWQKLFAGRLDEESALQAMCELVEAYYAEYRQK